MTKLFYSCQLGFDERHFHPYVRRYTTLDVNIVFVLLGVLDLGQAFPTFLNEISTYWLLIQQITVM